MAAAIDIDYCSDCLSAVQYNHTKPEIPATAEAIKTPVFAINKSSGEWAKPSSAMNIDIVKPIPPIRAAPTMCLKFRPAGKEVRPSLTATQENPAMPTSLPITSPAVIPTDTGCVTILPKADQSTGTPAFASANIGIIR